MGLQVRLYAKSASALECGGWPASLPGRFNHGKESRYPLYRRLSVPWGWSGWVREISPFRDSKPEASSSTGYHITAPSLLLNSTDYRSDSVRNLYVIRPSPPQKKLSISPSRIYLQSSSKISFQA
jgi:hypothetical protein